MNIPEHALLCRVGQGSYGEVWLARNAIGRLRAVKIVRRDRFDHERPYQREFEGIRRYEPVSRSHEGLVDILQLGRNDEHGYFYYIMEAADDANGPSGQPGLNPGAGTAIRSAGSSSFIPESYRPRTLREEKEEGRRLPLTDCVRIGATLAGALAHLHRNGLVHRDVKPSNVILADGVPKLADIGLVAALDEARSFVGTEGFIPPEGPGTPQADLYSLGKLLYEISTGKDRNDFPQLPAELQKSSDRQSFAEWNDVVVKACARDLRDRYRSAEEMHHDLLLLLAGRPLRRRHFRRRGWRRVSQIALALFVAGGLAGVVLLNHIGLAAATFALSVSLAAYFKYRRNNVTPAFHEPVSSATASTRTRVITVLPLQNHSPSTDDAHLGEEMAIEFAAKLTRIPSIKVLPRHSAVTLHSAPDPVATARSVGVDALLDGAVRRSKERLHVLLELTDTSDGFLRWSQSYDVGMADIFAIQTNCALQVAEAFGVLVPETLRLQLAQSATRDLYAYDCYLLGRRHLNNRAPQDFVKAVSWFQKAIQADPGYALAYTGLAEAYQYLGYGFGTRPARDVAAKARAAALKAVELGPNLAETHTALAIVRALLDWKWDEAEMEFRRALELNPNYAATYHFHGFFLAAVRQRFDAALDEARRALQLDPLSLPLNNFVGVVLFFAGRAEESIQHQQHWLETVPKPSGAEPELSFAQKVLGRAYESLGEQGKSATSYLRELELHGVPAAAIEKQRAAFERAGWAGFWRVRTAGLQTLWAQGGQPWFIAYEIALGHARLGEMQRTFEWLERIYEARCGILLWLKIEPVLASIRDEPRYRELLAKVGLH